MHIENITINVQHPTPLSTLPGDMLATLNNNGNVIAQATAEYNTLTPPKPGELWPGHGGHYICTLPATSELPARHLIVSSAEQGEIAWGGYDSEADGASSQIDGRANTRALITIQHRHPAAQWAANHTADGHQDFHLPSRHDLLMCYMHAPQLFRKDDWYWSSSQYSRYGAWAQDFEYGCSGNVLKGGTCLVRAVRWIQL